MRKFILGVGAQKAGTSWLPAQVSRHPDFRPSQAKELHVLDAIYPGDQLPFRAKLVRQFAETLQRHPDTFQDHFITRRFHMLLDPQEYLRYFDEVIDTKSGFSCDITPSYSALPSDSFGFVKAGMKEGGIVPKAVFLMREPLTRRESALRMQLSRRDALPTSVDEAARLLDVSAGDTKDRLRSSYRNTVTALRSQFDEDEIFLGFYQTMFQPSELKRLADFLELAPGDFDTSEYVNRTKAQVKYPKALLSRLLQRYSDEYDFACNDLGLDETIWRDRVAQITA